MDYTKFCYTKGFNSPDNTSKAQKAVAYKSKYWDKGHNLKVFFIGGRDNQRLGMMRIMEEMIAPLSLTVSQVLSPNISDIRISFIYGGGSYSYMGTDALFVGKEKETLNIGWAGDDVMYHEFGHALGLVHEHQNPKEGITWNQAEVIRDLSGDPNYWSEDTIRHNVLDKVPLSAVDATEFDPESIMLYYFPSTWTIGNTSTNKNIIPSITDKAFLESKYKYFESDLMAPTLTLTGGQSVVVFLGEKYQEHGATAWDNKDGDLTDEIKVEELIQTSKTPLLRLRLTDT